MIITEKEAEEFLEHHGFPVLRRVFCTTLSQCTAAAQRIGYPVAMKISSRKILHKSDVGGVVLNIIQPSQLAKTFRHMKKIRGFEGVLVQQYIIGDCLLLGLQKDPSFGHAIALGSGGIYTEMLKDVSFRVCPLAKEDARDMLQEIKMYPVVKGMRGSKNHEREVIALLLKLSALSQHYPMIEELDINPLILHEHGVAIVDARIILEEKLVLPLL